VIQKRKRSMINTRKKDYRMEAAAVRQALETSSACLEVVEEAAVAVKDQKKENLLCIQLKRLLKTYIMERLPKLLCKEIEFVPVAMAKVVKKELSKTVRAVKEEALK